MESGSPMKKYLSILTPLIALQLALCFLLCNSFSGQAGNVPSAPKEKPSIIFILADDLGYGDVSCYNAQSKVPTPRRTRRGGSTASKLIPAIRRILF